MKIYTIFLLFFPFLLPAQEADCVFGPPVITVHFGAGDVRDLNAGLLAGYRRTANDCPRDGQYTYTSFTSDCFNGDWLTLTEDHTPGDAAGNMFLVNAAWSGGTFLTTTINGLKGNTTYEVGAWLMNVCKPSDKCPFPLLPNIIIRLHTPDGKTVAQFSTGELIRRNEPRWTQYRGVFTTPAAASLLLTMIDDAPGGCGNDFALDDITFRECVKRPPVVTTVPKSPAVVKRQPVAKPVVKKDRPVLVKRTTINQTAKPQAAPPLPVTAIVKQRVPTVPPPPVLTARENPLTRRIETEAGEIKLDLYDNGEIDGDTVSIYHNNVLVVSRAGLSQKPVSFRIAIDAGSPHHEVIMVANNLGSIPPNTSLMIVTTTTKRYEVFISSTEQKNAKLVLDLKD